MLDKTLVPGRKNRWHGWTEEELVSSVRRISQNGIMPKWEELAEVKANSLIGGITKFGGYDRVADLAGLQRTSKYEAWGLERVLEELRPIAEKLGRMPTMPEVRALGEPKLTHQMAYHGTRKIAGLLGAELKGATTHLGNDFEAVAQRILEKLHYRVEKQTTCHPFDLLVGGIRVDVKAGRPRQVGRYRGHSWTLKGSRKTLNCCDLYMLMALDESSKLLRTYYVPSSVCTTTVATIITGSNSKWNVYEEDAAQLQVVGASKTWRVRK